MSLLSVSVATCLALSGCVVTCGGLAGDSVFAVTVTLAVDVVCFMLYSQ